MKIFSTILALTLSVAGLQATPVTSIHHSLIINGKLSTVVVASGTVDDIVSIPVNNDKLIDAVVSGTTGLRSKDLDVVIDDTSAEIDIIKKPVVSGTTTTTPAAVLFVVGQATVNSVTNAELHSNNPRHLDGLEMISDYQITLPNNFAPTYFPSFPVPAVADMYLKLGHSKSDSAEFANVTAANFVAGYGKGQPNCYIITGVASTTSKAYSY